MSKKIYFKILKILHITNWYPNHRNLHEALWIKRHIESLAPYCENHILHLEVKPGGRFSKYVQKDEKEYHLIIELPFTKWFLIELITFWLLVYFLIKFRVNRQYTLINFHIAYPLLTYWHLVKNFIKIPVIISEHWSAYHFNFNVADKNKLKKVKRIFRQNIPVITVSKALYLDIKNFSDADFPNYVLPNIVDDLLFRPQNVKKNNTPFFFMVSQWKWPKNPFVIIEAFAELLKEEDAVLEIGGYGVQLDKMEKLVNSLGIYENVRFLGRLDSSQIAERMKQATAFLHATEYETFSVVCAEAVCCGTPVVATNIGGIKEAVTPLISKCILLESNDPQLWLSSLKEVQSSFFVFDHDQASLINSFDSVTVGKRYRDILIKIIESR